MRYIQICSAQIGRREEIVIQKIIDKKGPGMYELKEIFGDKYWNGVTRPQKLGIKFSDLVKSGKLSGIKQLNKKSNKHMLYQIV